MQPSPDPASSRARLSAAERRRRLLDDAREEFIQRGFSAARTKDIAAATGVNEALLYKHFDSKQELFDSSILEPLDRAIAGLVERNSEPPETFDSTGDQVRAMTITFVRDLLVAMDEIGPLLIAALHSGNRSPLEAYRDLLEPYFETMSEVVETNLQSWSHQPFDPQLTTRMGFGAAFFITLSAQAKGEALDHDDVAEQIVSIFVDALHTPDAPPA